MKISTLIMTAVLFATGSGAIAKSRKLRTRKVDTRFEKRADTNHDGKVSREEAKAAREKYLENRSEVDKKWEERADKNNDGRIDGRELRKARQYQEKKTYLKNRSEVNKKWEERADKNNDGKVDRKELRQSIKKRKKNKSR